MSFEVFDDIKKIFKQIGITTADQGSIVNSVYTLNGVFNDDNYNSLTVTVIHDYWPHFSSISISIPCLTLPRKKISVAYELINRINCCLKYDHFKINPEDRAVQLYAGFYSGMVSGDEEEADEADDDSEFSDSMDFYSYYHLRMLISQMIGRCFLFSSLFQELITTNKPVQTIFNNFMNNLTKEEKNIIDH